MTAQASEALEIAQADDNDQWIVLRGDEVVAGPFCSQDAAERWRADRLAL